MTLFFRIFIPGRAKHVLILKQSYLEEVNLELISVLLEKSMCKKWVEMAQFTLETKTTKVIWVNQKRCFKQYYGKSWPDSTILSIYASKWYLEGFLFPLVDISPYTHSMQTYKENICIIIFRSFWQKNTQTRYDIKKKNFCNCTLPSRSQVVSYIYYKALYRSFRFGKCPLERPTNEIQLLSLPISLGLPIWRTKEDQYQPPSNPQFCTLGHGWDWFDWTYLALLWIDSWCYILVVVDYYCDLFRQKDMKLQIKKPSAFFMTTVPILEEERSPSFLNFMAPTEFELLSVILFCGIGWKNVQLVVSQVRKWVLDQVDGWPYRQNVIGSSRMLSPVGGNPHIS